MARSVRSSLLGKSREAALTAVQAYNNPLTRFKSETFIVLMTIAWTYLLHAYYRREAVEYRYLDDSPGSKRKFQRTAGGGYRWWELGACLRAAQSPLDPGTANNLRFLIGLRNEIEHHMPPQLDQHLSGRYLACVLNYDYWVTQLFGERFSLSGTVAMALQFSDIAPTDTPTEAKLPARVSRYIEQFEGDMTQEEYDDPRFAFRLLFTRRLANRKGQADRAIEFVNIDDAEAAGVPPERWLIKPTEKPKYRPTDVLQKVRAAGCAGFGMHQHTELWKALGAKDPAAGFGTSVSGQWYWYDTWIEEVIRRCRAGAEVPSSAGAAVG